MLLLEPASLLLIVAAKAIYIYPAIYG